MEPTTDHDLIIRIDQNLQNIQLQMRSFVTKDEFGPVQSIAFGMVALVMIAVIGALISVVIRKKKD